MMVRFGLPMLALLVALATACGGSDDSSAPPQSTEAGTVPGGTGETTTDGDAFMVDWGPARPTVGGALMPLDPHSATALEDLAIDIGSSFASVSPDGLSIVISPVAGREDEPGVRVIDAAGRAERFSLDEPRGLNPLAWSANGERLYGVRSAETTDGGRGRELWSIDLEARAAQRIALVRYQFETIRIAPDETRIYILGYELDGTGEGFIDVIGTASGEALARIALPGLPLGARTPLAGLPEAYIPGWDVSPDGRTLYIASPIDDTITIVDLDALAVKRTVEVRHPQGMLQRLTSALRDAFVPRASAHGVNVFEKQVAVSPDGATLYVTGTSDDICSEDSEVCLHLRPAGLQAIDTTSMSVVATVESVGTMAFSSDGSTIFASGYSSDDIAFARGELVLFGEGLRVLDAGTLELRAHALPDAPFAQVAPGRGGRYVYLLTAETTPRLVVYDAIAGEVVAEQSWDAPGAVLLPPGR